MDHGEAALKGVFYLSHRWPSIENWSLFERMQCVMKTHRLPSFSSEIFRCYQQFEENAKMGIWLTVGIIRFIVNRELRFIQETGVSNLLICEVIIVARKNLTFVNRALLSNLQKQTFVTERKILRIVQNILKW